MSDILVPNSTRTLTDADVDAIVDGMLARLAVNVGKGVLKLAWRGVVLGLIFLAAYGYKPHG